MNFKITPLIQEIEGMEADRAHNNKSTENQSGAGVLSGNHFAAGADNLQHIFEASMSEKPRP